MNKKLQEMWDSAHEIPFGAFVSEGTPLVRFDHPDRLYFYSAARSFYWNTVSDTAPVRSLDPLPDMDDTGTITVHLDGERIAVVVEYDARCYTLSRNQARNLARKITEAIDGH